MLLLLADGFLHFLFVFEYDILMSYAVTGIIVALLVRRKIKLIKILALILGILHIAGVLLISFILEAGMRFPGSQEEFSLALMRLPPSTLQVRIWIKYYFDSMGYFR